MTDMELDLKDYVEGRFSRLADDIKEKLKAQQAEIMALIAANDLRYQQRFDAQGKALDAAFGAAKGAVDAALAASDKAAAKTEISADKRFEDLGNLIKEQFKGMGDKFDSTVKRVDDLAERVTQNSGQSEGKTTMWGYVAAAIGILFGLSGVILTIIHLMKTS